MPASNSRKTYCFIRPKDELAILINEKANLLFEKLRQIDVQQSQLDAFGKYYLSNHHLSRRLHFSLESSAAIIYASVKMSGKPVAELNFTDYGAGLGTLFLLAGMMGFKEVFYNDHFASWEANARILCRDLDIEMTGYIVGDIDELIAYAKEKKLRYDIIASRNVIEHIYDLPAFYSKLYHSGIAPLFYSTTTANYHNPLMLLKHRWMHKKLERSQFRQQRKEKLQRLLPGINGKDLDELTELARGRAFADFDNAVQAWHQKKAIAPVPWLGSNTCDCENGVWAEHIIPRRAYKEIIEGAGYRMEYSAGFWDTHYRYAAFNWFTALLNRLAGKKGYRITPFVNVIASKP